MLYNVCDLHANGNNFTVIKADVMSIHVTLCVGHTVKVAKWLCIQLLQNYSFDRLFC